MTRPMPDPFRPPTPQPPRPEGLPPDPWRPPPLHRSLRSSASPPPESPDPSGPPPDPPPDPEAGPALDPTPRWWTGAGLLSLQERLGLWLLRLPLFRDERRALLLLLALVLLLGLGQGTMLILRPQ